MTLQRRANDVRLLWRSIPPRGKRAIRTMWPSWVAIVFFLVASPLFAANHNTTMFLCLAGIGLAFMLLALLRLNVLMKDVDKRMKDILNDDDDRPPLS